MYTRVQNTTSAVTIKCAKVNRIIPLTAVASKTLTLKDGGTTIGVATFPATLTNPHAIEVGMTMQSGQFVVTPNDTGFDVLVVTDEQ